MVLAQARLLRYLDGELTGVPWVVARNRMNMRSLELWLGLSWDVANYVRIWELHLALRCVIRSMVSARALSIVADRCGSKAS
ncbi:hypothetical protein DEO72_LG5g2296 [Vigna unguiculata]|uniref:Uncharacterized protein n=1 Tax=Vigna unguiculata TaxID=3917 RepID=A0A4D6LZL6_VIGUN|nr:hypothetical protein DEO72_LG5g2296 [Vigna unguiculata]